MKVKKLLGSIFASVFAVTSIAALSACDEENPIDDPSGDVTATDEEIVQAALDALKVDATVSADFTLTTKGNGNVAISWASDNTDVISISEGAATVHRQLGEDKTVKLTATAVLNNVNKTKDFTVKVSKIEDVSTTVAEIKAAKLGAEVTAKGVVSGFVYASGTTDPEYACGYYVTDATGTIYVYDPSGASNLAVGNEVYLTGELSTKNSSLQISSVSDKIVLAATKDADWTTVVKDKTVADIVDSADKASTCGVVYELLVKFDKAATYKTYYAQDATDSSKSLLIFFSGSATNDKNDYKFDELIKDNIGKIARVRFVVNSLNSSSKPRGTVLAILPLTVEDQQALIDDAVNGAVELDSHITTAQEKALPTTIDGFDKCSIAWSLKDGSAGAAIAENTLTITPTETLQTFTLVATITVEGVTDPIVAEYTSMVKTSFDPVSNTEFIEAEDGDQIFIQGVVTYNNKTKNAVFIQDAQGFGYYLNLYGYEYSAADLAAGGKFALGKEIKVYGTRSTYNGLPQLNPLSVEGISDSTVPAPTDIAEIVKNDQMNTIISKYVTLDVLYSGSEFFTIDGKEVAYYDQFKINADLTAGKVYNIIGVIGYYNSAQLQPITITEKSNDTIDFKFVPLYLYGIMGMGEVFETQTVVDVPAQLFGYNLTYAVTSATPTVVYANNQVTINPTVAETSTLTVTPENGTPFNISITTFVRTVEVGSHTATLDFNGSTSTSINKNSAEFDESLVGLDSFYFTVVNNGTVKDCALNYGSNGYIRLSNEKAATANGAEMTVSLNSQTGYTVVINSITIAYGSNKSAPFTVNGTEYTSSTTTFDINSSSFTIKNISDSTSNTAVNLDIASIEISYTITAA